MVVHHTAATTQLSQAMFTLQQVWSTLEPHYITLNVIKDKIKTNRDLGLAAHSEMQAHKHDAAINGINDMEEWGLDDWEKKDADKVLRNTMIKVNSLKELDQDLNMHDVVNGTSGYDTGQPLLEIQNAGLTRQGPK